MAAQGDNPGNERDPKKGEGARLQRPVIYIRHLSSLGTNKWMGWSTFSAAPIAVSVIGVQGGVVFAIPAVNRSWLPVKQMLQPSALPPDLRPGGHVS